MFENPYYEFIFQLFNGTYTILKIEIFIFKRDYTF